MKALVILAAAAAAAMVACSSDGASVGVPADSGAGASGGDGGAAGGGSGGQAGSPAGGDAGQATGGSPAGGASGSGGAGQGGAPPDGGGGGGALDGGWTKDCHPNKFLCDVKMCAGAWMEWAKPPIAKRCCTGAYGPCGMDFQDGKGCIPCAAPLNEPKDT